MATRSEVEIGDVTAVVLTVGEAYTQRALASVERQAPAAPEVVVVRGTAPFHRALNEGAARVRTPYFVQVDADMVLDPTCIADLRACAAERIGVVIGHLRDPLVGRVAGVKLFRAACFDILRFPDSISPDTDFCGAIAVHDWRTVYAIKQPTAPGAAAHVFGDHQPDYTPLYTFRKYMLQGARHRYRRSGASVRQLFLRLRDSRHDAALIAMIGAAHGIFLPTGRDLLEPYAGGADFERLTRFLQDRTDEERIPAEVRTIGSLDVATAWQRGYRCGIELHRRRTAGALAAALRHLIADEGTVAWVALVGICQGLFADEYDDAAVELAFTLLNPLLPSPYRRRDCG